MHVAGSQDSSARAFMMCCMISIQGVVLAVYGYDESAGGRMMQTWYKAARAMAQLNALARPQLSLRACYS
jgi:hypothetical protein